MLLEPRFENEIEPIHVLFEHDRSHCLGLESAISNIPLKQKKRVKRNQRQNTVKRQKEPITQEQETLFISIAAQMDKTEEEEEEEPIKRATKLYTSQIKKQTKRNNGLIGCCCVFFFVKN